MKKLLSALLIATLLIASVACVFAVAEEDGDTATDPVVYNFLAAMKDADTEDYTLVNNEDGSVTITIKKVADADYHITIVDAFDAATIDLLKDQLYVAIDFETEGDFDFYFNYTRADKAAENKVAQLYWTGARKTTDSIVSSTDGSLVWDLNKYITGTKLFEDGKHDFIDLLISSASVGQTITFKTLAIVNDPDAMTVGTPLVPGNTSSTTTSSEDDSTSSEDNATSSEDNATSSEEAATSSEASTSSSDAPITGDTGMIVFAVLAVVALAGGFVVVRARG